MNRLLRHIAFLLLLLLGWNATSQNYPVQAFVSIAPPHSPKLSEYSNPFDTRFKIILTNTDFAAPALNVKVRLKINGSGFSLVSNVLNTPQYLLAPGAPLEITGSDLTPYFATNNLSIQGLDPAVYDQGKTVPSGITNVCVEVIDVSSSNQAVISNPACTVINFAKYLPPIVNFPICGYSFQQHEILTPPMVNFSWSMLGYTSPNLGDLQYKFQLFQVLDPNIPPNMQVNGPVLYEEITSNNFINFSLQAPLTVGSQYVWRVQAFTINGGDLFENNGWSEVCTFTYGDAAENAIAGETIQLQSNGTAPRQGFAWWNQSNLYNHYILEVRKTGNPDFAWFPYQTDQGDLKINSLEPETEYECRVKGVLGSAETDWSNVSTFTTLPKVTYGCGSQDLPATNPNIKPAIALLPGDIVQCGQFEMQVVGADPGSQAGRFTGYGKVSIPFMFMNMNVEFTDVLIDEDLQLRDGKVEAITEGVADWMLEQFKIFVQGSIDEVQVNQADSVFIFYLGDGDTMHINWPTDGPVMYEDENGKVVILHPNGTFEILGQLNIDNDPLFARQDYQIRFEASNQQNYGFDSYPGIIEWQEYYPVIKLEDSTYYYVPWKCVGSGNTDKVLAICRGNVGTPSFLDKNGNPCSSVQINDSTYEVTVGNLTSTGIAVYGLDDSGMRIGKLNLLNYASKNLDVVVVPVNGAVVPNQSALEDRLNEIFGQAYAFFGVEIDSNFNSQTDYGINGLDAPDATLMKKYSTEMRTLRDEYFSKRNKENKLYLFVVDDIEGDLDGYMVRGKSVGFIEEGQGLETYAHELGHGAFGLEHTFPIAPKGSTNNLMDYHAAHVTDNWHLRAKQWADIHDWAINWSIFDDEEDGGVYGQSGTSVTKICKPSARAQVNVRSIFVAPDGSFVDLDKLPGAIANKFYDVNDSDTNVVGTLNGFVYNGLQYVVMYNTEDPGLESSFVGYAARDENQDLVKLFPEDFEADPGTPNNMASLCVIDCTDKMLYFKNLDGSDDGSTPLACDNCTQQFGSVFFYEEPEAVNLIKQYVTDFGFASRSYFGPSGPLVDKVNSQIYLHGYDNFVGDPLTLDRIKGYHVHNPAGNFYIAPIPVDKISRNEEDWHYFAKTIFDYKYLKEDDILITIPYKVLDYANNPPVIYYMPGLAYGNNVSFDDESLKAQKFVNSWEFHNHPNLQGETTHYHVNEFINHVFKSLVKSLDIYEGVLNPNGSIVYNHYHSDAISGFDQSAYVTLYINEAFDDVVANYIGYVDMKAAYNAKKTHDSNYTIAQYNEDVNELYWELKENTMDVLESATPGNVRHFAPREQDLFLFKDQEITEERAREYILKKAFDEYIDAMSGFNLADPLTGFVHPGNGATWNQDQSDQTWFDDVVYGGLDVVGVFLAFSGLDVITDGLGFIYANARGQEFNAITYAASIFILGVPTVATKTVAKEVLENGTQWIIRYDGTKVIMEEYNEVLHSLRAKYQVNGSLTNNDVLRLKELEDAGKITDVKAIQFFEAADNPQLQKQILKELSSDLDLWEMLGWNAQTKQLFESDLNAVDGIDLKNMFDIAGDAFDQKRIAQSWEILRNAGYNTFRKNPEMISKLNNLIFNPNILSSGLNENLISRAIAGNHSAGAGQTASSLGTLLDGYNELVTSGTKFINFEKILTDLEKGGNFTTGAGWIQKYITNNTSEFLGKNLQFEVNMISGRIDLKVSNTLYEFKSVSNVPPQHFAGQFARDLENASNLSEIKWYFDANKLPNGISLEDKELMLATLEAMNLNQQTIDKYVPNGTLDDLIDLIEGSFDQLFYLK